MDAETSQALEDSIEHWRRNVEAEAPGDVSIGPENCALCNAFRIEEYFEAPCDGCPVAAKTGAPCCRGTPYVSVENVLSDWKGAPASTWMRDAWRALAAAELAFLESLREAT